MKSAPGSLALPDGPFGPPQQIDARYVIMPPRVNCAFKFIDYANMVRAGMVTPTGETAIEGRELNRDEAQTYSASLQTLRQYIMGEISADPEPWPDEASPEPEDVVVIKDLTPGDLADLLEVSKKRALDKALGNQQSGTPPRESPNDYLRRILGERPQQGRPPEETSGS